VSGHRPLNPQLPVIPPKTVVFLASASALVLTSLLGVVAGTVISEYLNPRVLSWIAGVGFIGIGIWTLVRA
jgi:putative Ca2+/H+ antiporter (TMEM165/GDT1 family)